MQTEFLTKLDRITTETDSRVVLMMSPKVQRMPLPIRRYDDPFLPFGKEVIRATREIVCGYVFDLAAYLSIGAAGAVALERTLSLIAGERLAILHGPFSGPSFFEITDENSFEADAVTLADAEHLIVYLSRPDRSAFVQIRDVPPTSYLNELTQQAGLYWPERKQMITSSPTSETVTLWIAGEDILYSGSGEDYLDRMTSAIVKFKAGLDYD